MADWTQDDAGTPVGGGDFWKAADHLGELTLFVVVERDEAPKYGDPSQTETIAKVRNAVVLDGPNSGDVYDASQIFGNLGRSLAGGAPAKFMVGRVTEGPKKPGQNAPHILEDATDEDMRKAIAFLTEHAEKDSAGNPVLAQPDKEGAF